MNTKHYEVLALLQELQQYGTIERVFTYGILDTLFLALSRISNREVEEYFRNYLETLDEAVVYFNNNGYKVNVKREDLGELYNSSRMKAPPDGYAEEFFTAFFDGLNVLVLETLKAGIDYCYDNDINLKGTNSLRKLGSLNINDQFYNYIKSIINGYYDVIANKPQNIISLFSYLKRFRITTDMITKSVGSLETEIVSYIRTKFSVNELNIQTRINI